MLETEKQRRWWFATHPEFSQKGSGTSGHGKEEDNDRIRPEDVDMYVNEQLEYARGFEAEVLK